MIPLENSFSTFIKSNEFTEYYNNYKTLNCGSKYPLGNIFSINIRKNGNIKTIKFYFNTVIKLTREDIKKFFPYPHLLMKNYKLINFETNECKRGVTFALKYDLERKKFTYQFHFIATRRYYKSIFMRKHMVKNIQEEFLSVSDQIGVCYESTKTKIKHKCYRFLTSEQAKKYFSKVFETDLPLKSEKIEYTEVDSVPLKVIFIGTEKKKIIKFLRKFGLLEKISFFIKKDFYVRNIGLYTSDNIVSLYFYPSNFNSLLKKGTVDSYSLLR
jgi:hypothetical protein